MIHRLMPPFLQKITWNPVRRISMCKKNVLLPLVIQACKPNSILSCPSYPQTIKMFDYSR
eukprot:05596.XXX_74924_75103_1 [CDS] Oithona nana genome sequencing.